MITTETETQIIIHKCRHCGSTNLVRNGHNRCGTPQYRCNDCGDYRVLEPKRPSSTDRKSREHPERKKVLRACLERCSLRGVARIFRLSRNTIVDWVIEHVARLPVLGDTIVPMNDADVLELDELWSFVQNKGEKRWVWTALCRRTRQIIAYVIGDHSAETCRRLWSVIPETYRQQHCYTDLWQPYQTIIPSNQHTAVGKGSGETNHMERWYGTLRQRVGRLTRKTLSFSKKDEYHELFIQWFIIEHNLRIQSSLT